MKLRCAILCAFLFGGIAQLVERLNGIQKVRGSTPLTSTIKRKIERKTANGRLFFVFVSVFEGCSREIKYTR